MTARKKAQKALKPARRVASNDAVVTRIISSGAISPDPAYRNSIVFLEVDRTPNPAGGDFVHHVRWLMAGRDGIMTSSVDYQYTGRATFRVDVPTGTTVTDDYLERALNAFVQGDGRPEDTVIIRK